MRRLLHAFLLLTLPLAPGGCTALAVATLDEKLSQITEQDCNINRLLVGEPWCRSRTVAGEHAPLYCFRTLGGVDCHDGPDPYGTGTGRAVPPPALQTPAPEPAKAVAVGR